MATHERVTQSPGLPPQLVLYQMATGHYISGALHLAAKLGLADPDFEQRRTKAPWQTLSAM